MRSDILKHHMTFNHGNVKNTPHHKDCHPEFEMITNDERHNNESLAEGCKVEELDDSLVTYTANVKFELLHDDEVYQKITLPSS